MCLYEFVYVCVYVYVCMCACMCAYIGCDLMSRAGLLLKSTHDQPIAYIYIYMYIYIIYKVLIILSRAGL